MGWFLLLIIVCIALWIGGLYGTHYFVEKHWHSEHSIAKEEAELRQSVLADSGVLGDSSGAINALFSALAFAGVIFAIILQKKELGLQREELEQTREELKGQKEEFKQQNETLRRQRFENTFFQMMSLQQEIVNSLTCTNNISNGGSITITKNSGRDVFKALYEEDIVYYKNPNGYLTSYNSLKELLLTRQKEYRLSDGNIQKGNPRMLTLNPSKFDYSPYNETLKHQYLDHYFRHLYRMIKFIDETPLLPADDKKVKFKERYQYTCMIRATLSRYEFIWLFYNGLSENGVEKFKPLIEKYALLRGIRLDMLAIDGEKEYYQDILKSENTDSIDSKNFYNKSAFVKIPPVT